MKILMTLFTGIMLMGCAGADHQSTMVALGSSAVFHTENEAKPYPWQQGGDQCSLSLVEVTVFVRLDHIAGFIVNANQSAM